MLSAGWGSGFAIAYIQAAFPDASSVLIAADNHSTAFLCGLDLHLVLLRLIRFDEPNLRLPEFAVNNYFHANKNAPI